MIRVFCFHDTLLSEEMYVNSPLVDAHAQSRRSTEGASARVNFFLQGNVEFFLNFTFSSTDRVWKHCTSNN